MALFPHAEQRFAKRLSRLMYCNQFLPERIDLERELLGDNFVPAPPVYSNVYERGLYSPNVAQLNEQVESLAGRARQRLEKDGAANKDELDLYDDLVAYVIYHRFCGEFDEMINRGQKQPGELPHVPFWKRFVADFSHFTAIAGRTPTKKNDPAHMLAIMFQVRRATYQIYHSVSGTSGPVTKLRATIWQSLFTHDPGRYLRLGLHDHMGRIPTLITGPSGTGKELVAKAVGLARFIPFDPRQGKFKSGVAGSFHALNLSALASPLIESELFGHAKGAFTGAVEPKEGWLEKCDEHETVFLDEIGELDPAIQVKLLRVLQERTFHRMGETKERHFRGKVIVATNRDLAEEMHAGRFRKDFYYRLCGDMITTPSLQEQLTVCPEDLSNFIRFIVKRITNIEVDEVATQVEDWIRKQPSLGLHYPWPGNFRELEQCVWNVLIRKEYHPARPTSPDDPVQELGQAVIQGSLSADELERSYYSLLFAQTDSYQETARRLGRNWRTVKAKINPAVVLRMKGKTKARL
jgi:hypothetical protein